MIDRNDELMKQYIYSRDTHYNMLGLIVSANQKYKSE